MAMIASWLYDPDADCFARVVQKRSDWQAQCCGRQIRGPDERQAIEAAEQLLDQRVRELKRPG